MSKQIETFEPPQTLDHNNVIHYSHYLKELVDKHGKKVLNPIRLKAQKFVGMKLIRYDPEFKCYFCDPIPDYNKSICKLEEKNGKFECDCKMFIGGSGKLCPNCSKEQTQTKEVGK